MPERVELVLRDFGTGGLNAGDLRTYQSLRLTATEVREWSFTGEAFDYAPDHHMEGIEPVETSAGIGLILDVPTLVRLVAGAFACERLPTVTETVPPWTSGIEFSVTAQRADRPSPAQWVEALALQGADVTWRIYGGPAQPTGRVPADYVGWFLERPSRLSEHDGGVFVSHIGEEAHGIVLRMERNQADDELWRAVCRSVAHMFPDGEFSSGNCQFTADEWLTHLTTTSD
jgi:hypothetical protein